MAKFDEVLTKLHDAIQSGISGDALNKLLENELSNLSGDEKKLNEKWAEQQDKNLGRIYAQMGKNDFKRTELVQLAAIPHPEPIHSVRDVIAWVNTKHDSLQNTELGAQIKRIQDLNDYLYLVRIFRARDLGFDITKLPAFAEFNQLTSMLAEKIFGTSGGAGNFVPTELSAELIRLVELKLQLTSLIPTMSMPTPTFKLPVQGPPASAYLVSETTTDQAELTAANWIPASTPGASAATITAKKFGVLVDLSTESIEASIVPAVEYIRERMARGIANGLENALINGDSSATHMDADVTSANDVRKAWNGLRKVAKDRATDTVSLATFDETGLLKVKAEMGAYGILGVDTDEVLYVCSVAVASKFLNLTAGFTAYDSLGTSSPKVRGEIGTIWGVPVVASPYVRDDLSANGYNTATGPNDKSVVICFNTRSFVRGIYRDIEVKSREVIETDVTRLVVTARWGFINAINDDVVAVGVGVVPTV